MSSDIEQGTQEIFKAAKRVGLRRFDGIDDGDWFCAWNPRNGNTYAEGHWGHWVNLARFILSHPATEKVDPAAYRPELPATPNMYVVCGRLTACEVDELFVGPSLSKSSEESDEL